MPITSSRLQVTHHFSLVWLQIRGSQDLLHLGCDYLLEELTELRERLTFIILLKDMILKNTDEETHRVRPGRVPSTHCGVGVCHPPSTTNVTSNLEALWTPYYWDFMEAASCRHDHLLATFLAPFPSLKKWEAELKITTLVFLVALSFLWPGSTWEPPRNPPRVTPL